jgi:hypothetical protein
MIVALLVLVCGCVSNTPWEPTSISGPWCAPEERSVVYTRTHDAYMLPGAQQQTAFSTRSSRNIGRSSIGEQIDELLAPSEILASWPGSGSHYGNIEQRKPPFDLYLVAIDPIVLIGVSGTTRPVFNGQAVFSACLRDVVRVSTELPLPTGDSIMFFRSDQNRLKATSLQITTVPLSVSLDRNDYIRLTRSGDRLLIARTKTVHASSAGDPQPARRGSRTPEK